MTDNNIPVWVIIAVAIIVLVGLWSAFFGSCDLYKFTPAGQIPARCLETYTLGV